MTFNISAQSIRAPMLASVLFLILTLLGVVSFNNMPITNLPKVEIPIISISIRQFGASPDELDAQVTKIVESAIISIKNVWHINSMVSEGVSNTIVQFQVGTTTPEVAFNDVRHSIDALRYQLPSDIEEPIISKIDVTEGMISAYAISAPSMHKEELSHFAKDTVANALRSLKGVGRVSINGEVTREIQVSLDPHKLAEYGITAADVNQQIRLTNVNLYSGRSKIDGEKLTVRTMAAATSIDNIESMPIRLPHGGQIPLKTIATITDGHEEERGFALVDGMPAVIIGIKCTKSASEVSVAKAVERQIEELQKQYKNVEFKEIDNSVDSVIDIYHETLRTFAEGSLLTILIVLLFLRDIRATIIAALALPLSIIPTFYVIDLLGFSLNRLSMLAITLVTGILVDDAIVEIENITRHMQNGKKPYRASIEAADEIGLAVVAISLTIVAIFIPVAFMPGTAGPYFRQFGLTVAISVFISLMVARLITPVLAAYLLKAPKEPSKKKDGYILTLYTHLVHLSVKYRWITLSIGILFLTTSIGTVFLLPGDFLPNVDTGRANLLLELPPNSQLRETRKIAQKITSEILAIPEVTSVLTYGGTDSITSQMKPQKANLIIRFVNAGARELSVNSLQQLILNKLSDYPDVMISFKDEESGKRGDISVVLTGTDRKLLEKTAAKLLGEMKTIPNITNPSFSANVKHDELHIVPKPLLGTHFGTSAGELANSIRIATTGDQYKKLSKFDAGDKFIPIRVMLKEEHRDDLADLKSLHVTTRRGLVPISAIADFKIGTSPSDVVRRDRKLKITLDANLKPDVALSDAYAAIISLPTVRHLPPGIELLPSHTVEAMHDVNRSFMQAMRTGLILVYGVLGLLFGGFIHPITILSALPFAIGGTVVTLLITNNAISLPVVIGILMLLGIVTKNSIMIVDFALTEIAAGLPSRTAIVQAGRKRARPILMTSGAMIGGMLPSAIGMGSHGAFSSPMALSVIGGLVASTFLSLLFTPAIFTFFDDISSSIHQKTKKWINEPDE